MSELCVACEKAPNCDNSWYKSGLCATCLYISRQSRCQECYNSPLYCVCDNAEANRQLIREQYELDEGRPRVRDANKPRPLLSIKINGLPPLEFEAK